MGLSTKQVSGDQGLDWGHTFLQSSAAAAETSKPPAPAPTRRQQQQAEALKCPRCASDNTKFCYYNNYNKSQPRHFCKSCKRHWTKGGTLRNVPVGGGRKNKRPKPSKSAPAALRHQDPPAAAGQKNMSSILYLALVGRSSSPSLHGTSKGFDSISLSAPLPPPPPQLNPNTEFNFSSVTNFDMNTSLTSSYQPLHAFDHHFAGNLDSVEESTITTANIPGCSGGGAWESSSTLDLPSYWNWNEIDVLTSGDLSISWDAEDNHKAVMKP